MKLKKKIKREISELYSQQYDAEQIVLNDIKLYGEIFSDTQLTQFPIIKETEIKIKILQKLY